MICPYCGGRTLVIDSRNRKKQNYIYRRRRCAECSITFGTQERIIDNVVTDISSKKGRMKR